jgi:outer membrane receptor protein involved in Fe transport
VKRLQTIALAILVALLLATPTAVSQSLPSATLSGKVSSEGQGLPGVSVTAKSPGLQGTRTSTTSVNGGYVFANLPPGEYTITFSLSGFQTTTRTLRLAASQSQTVDATMSLSKVESTAVVTATAETISESPSAQTTYAKDLLDKLPVTRTLASAVVLAPGVNSNGPNGMITISGAQSFDNLITVNGVVITDNIRGTPNNLFIEDAIQETTTSTSGISAEFGRFTGGVINSITRSGGNVFSGTFRATLTNDAWAASTPLTTEQNDKTNPVYEATLGGPIWKDHVWFFAAGRYQDTEVARQTASPVSTPYLFGDEQRRLEGKLTLTPFQNHTLVGSYTDIQETFSNFGYAATPFYDLASVFTMKQPNSLLSLNYNGVLTQQLFVEAQYSRRKFTFEDYGASTNDLILGTPIYDLAASKTWNSPQFCGTGCPDSDEKRDNEDILVKGTWFLSTKSLGSHNVVFGFDDFSGSRYVNNYVSGSAYFVNATESIYENGNIYPVFDGSSYLGYYPIVQPPVPSDIRTYSVFLNDSWRLNDFFSFNLGVRWDKNNAKDTAGLTRADDQAWSPRLAVTYDPAGNGKLRFSASYAKYVGAIQEGVVGDATGAGNPFTFQWYYTGPDVNTDPNAPLVSTHDAMRAFFAWFGVTGPNQMPPGPFDYASAPGISRQIRQSLVSPSNEEWAVGVNGALGTRGSYRLDAVYRTAGDFYATRRDLTTGQVSDEFGNEYDLGLIENISDPLERTYVGLNTQFSYRALDGLNVGGNWTWSHTYGNFVGESASGGPSRSAILEYPEYIREEWAYPGGSLSQDQRHRVRLYATWDVPIPKAAGELGLSGVFSWDTGVPYGAVGTALERKYVTNPGYVRPPTRGTYYFTSRDAFRTPDVTRFDLALNYAYSIGPVQLFVQPQVLNVFNSQEIIADFRYINTTTVSYSSSSSSGLQDFNPYTTKPVEGTNWRKGSLFGQATDPRGYQQPRTFTISMGLRF